MLLRHRRADCPVVVARDVGGAAESVTVATLAGFDAGRVDMRTLLVVGSSTTRLVTGAGGRTLVYTPRSYP